MNGATDLFLERYRTDAHVEPITLVKIDFVTPAPLTIRLSDRKSEAGGFYWQPAILKTDPIDARLAILDCGPSPVEFGFQIGNSKLTYQTDGAGDVHDSLGEIVWRRAVVTMYQWLEGLPDFSHAFQMFSGEIVKESGTPDIVTLLARQRVPKQPVPVRKVTLAAWPGAPDSSLQRWEPVLIGEMPAPRLRDPYATAYGKRGLLDSVGAGRGVAPAVLVDTGRSGGKVGVLFASHQLDAFDDDTVGADVFIRGADTLAVVDATVNRTNDATGARMTFDLATLLAKVGVAPIDIRTPDTTAVNPLNALDLSNPETYALLDEPGGHGVLQLILPSAQALGDFSAVDLVIAYSTLSVSTGALVVLPRNSTGSPSGTPVSLTATTGYDDIAVAVLSYDSAWWLASNWNFANIGGTKTAIDLRLGYSSPTVNNIARIFWCALRPRYRPSMNIIRPETRKATESFDVGGRRNAPPRPGTKSFERGSQVVTAALEELLSDFFHNFRGRKDDGSGTFTDTAGALVQKAPDALHMLLRVYASLTNIEIGNGVFGSFRDARSIFETIDGWPITVGRALVDRGTVLDVGRSLMTETLGCWFINRFTGKHSVARWDFDPDVTYDLTLERQHLLGDDAFAWQASNEVLLSNGIDVFYGFDHFRGGHAALATLAPGASAGGFEQFNARDQYLTVAATVNDRVDFNDGVARVATILPADYVGGALMQELRIRMKAASASADIKVQYGFEIVASYNDQIYVQCGAGAAPLLLTPGVYTARSLARHLREVLAAAFPSLTWTVTYSARRFTIAVSAGTVQFKWTTTAGGADPVRSAALLLGFDFLADTAAAASLTSALDAAGETLRIGRAGALALNWATGPNVARSAGGTLGFTTAIDDTGSRIYGADFRRSHRERQLVAGDELQPPDEFRCGWIRTGPVATDTRDGLIAHRADQRLALMFATRKMPDVERMMVFTTGASLDGLSAFPVYGSDKSWAGKKWRVLQCRQRPSDTVQEILAVHCDRFGVAGTGLVVPTPTARELLLVWNDSRTSDSDPFALRVAGDGTPATGWPTNGKRLGQGVGSFANEVDTCPDLAGGQFVAWAQKTFNQIRVTRLDAAGNVVAGWTAAGTIIRVGSPTLSGLGAAPRIASDGAGGCIVTWTDTRGGANAQMYAQRMNGAGAAQWTANGVALTADATFNFHNPRILGDGSGGAFVACQGYGGTRKITAQRISSAGAIQWGTNGVTVASAGSSSFVALGELCSDAAGGIFLAFNLLTTATVQRLNVSGAPPSGWSATPLSLGATMYLDPIAMVPDSLGGAIVIWSDLRASTNEVYAQRVAAGGAIAWTSGGLKVLSGGTLANGFVASQLLAIADGAGGAFFACSQQGTGYTSVDIRAGLVAPSGTATWGVGGITVAAAADSQQAPRLVPDNLGGVYVAWIDRRSGTNYDVYVQRLSVSGAPQLAANGLAVCSASGTQDSLLASAP